MKDLIFAWDERKNALNRKKHGVDFAEAQTVFYDEQARLIFDPDHSRQEDRFILLGQSRLRKILVVCHCYREKESVIRIISARKATRCERESYESEL